MKIEYGIAVIFLKRNILLQKNHISENKTFSYNLINIIREFLNDFCRHCEEGFSPT